MRTRLIHSSLIALSLTACAAPNVTLPPISKAPRADLDDSPTNYIHLNIQPESEKQQAQELRKATAPAAPSQKRPKGKLNGTYYTRITGYWTPTTVDFEGEAKNVAIGKPNYDKDQREWLARLLAGKNRSFTLIATIGVDSRLSYKTTVPLYSVSHTSNGEGESFDVNLKDVWVSPLIRVTADTRLTTEVQAKRTQEIKTGAVSATLRVAQVAVEQIAPAGKVLTTLNQDQVKKEAKVWDSAIGQLFGQSAAETRGGTALTANWSHGQTAIISLQSPELSDAMMPAYYAGSWVFEITEIRMSLFSSFPCLREGLDKKCADRVVAAITPATVLNELVAEKTTLIGGLRKTDWYTVMLNAVSSEVKNGTTAASAKKKVQVKSAAQFCRQVAQAADEIGLTAIDAKLTLWALQRGEPLTSDILSAIADNDECKGIAAPFEFVSSDVYNVETTAADGAAPSP